MKKKFIALTLSLVLAIGLFGCGSKAATPGNETKTEKEKITVWAWDPNFNIAIMNTAKELYATENPDVEIEIIEMAKTDVEQKLHTILASGTTEDLPEIVLIEDYNSQKYLQSYPGSFEDLTGKIPHDKFAEYKVEVMTLDNKIYGLPFDTGVAGLYYRNDILAEAGFKAEDLQNITWERFLEIGKVVKEKTGKAMISIDPADLGLLRLMISTSGLWYFDAEGKPSIANNPQLKEGMLLMKEMIDTGVSELHSGWENYLEGFNSGRITTVATGVWMTPSVVQEESQKGLWNVAPIPKLEESGVNAANTGGSSWYVLSGSDSKNAAIDFLNKIYTNDDFYQTILTENGAVGSYLSSTKGEAYQKEQEFFDGQPIYADFSAWMAKIPAINVGMYTYEAEAIVINAFNDVLNGGDIDSALKSAEDQVKLQIQ